jgi:hypothetical protein
MHRLIRTAVAASTLVLVPLVRAEDKAKPEMPKPGAALTDACQGMTGTWACKGKWAKMDGSGTMDSKSTMVLKSILDGFGYSGHVTVEKSAMLPTGLKEELFWSYDASTKKLLESFADSLGGVGHGTSDGQSGDTTVWDEDAVMMGKAGKSRTTVKRNGPKEVILTFEIQSDGKWSTLGTNSCKKQ